MRALDYCFKGEYAVQADWSPLLCSALDGAKNSNNESFEARAGPRAEVCLQPIWPPRKSAHHVILCLLSYGSLTFLIPRVSVVRWIKACMSLV
jgi:hypothetical protein